MNDERLVTLIADVLALSRHLESIHHWPYVEALDSEGALFSIRWTGSHTRHGEGYETIVVGPSSGLVFENGGVQERSVQLTGERAFDKLTEMRSLFERVALDAEVRRRDESGLSRLARTSTRNWRFQCHAVIAEAITYLGA